MIDWSRKVLARPISSWKARIARIDLTGRAALVTGSTQGIDAAIATGLALAATGGAVRVDGGSVDSILP